MAGDRRSAFDSMLDVVVYAPIGAFFHGPEVVGELAARGRTQVSNARVIGKLAVDRGRDEASKIQARAQEQFGDLIVAVARAAGAPMAGADDPEPTGDDTSPSGDHAPTPPESTPDDTVLRVVPEQVPHVEELPIPDYDNLSASQVVPRLDSLATDELTAVRDYEQAHRGRMTILSRIAQLEAS